MENLEINTNQIPENKNPMNSDEEPIYIMTLELEQGKAEQIKIYSDSDSNELAYAFCKEHDLDYTALEYLKDQIEALIEQYKKSEENQIEEVDEDNIDNDDNVIDNNNGVETNQSNKDDNKVMELKYSGGIIKETSQDLLVSEDLAKSKKSNDNASNKNAKSTKKNELSSSEKKGSNISNNLNSSNVNNNLSSNKNNLTSNNNNLDSNNNNISSNLENKLDVKYEMEPHQIRQKEDMKFKMNLLKENSTDIKAELKKEIKCLTSESAHEPKELNTTEENNINDNGPLSKKEFMDDALNDKVNQMSKNLKASQMTNNNNSQGSSIRPIQSDTRPENNFIINDAISNNDSTKNIYNQALNLKEKKEDKKSQSLASQSILQNPRLIGKHNDNNNNFKFYKKIEPTQTKSAKNKNNFYNNLNNRIIADKKNIETDVINNNNIKKKLVKDTQDAFNKLLKNCEAPNNNIKYNMNNINQRKKEYDFRDYLQNLKCNVSKKSNNSPSKKYINSSKFIVNPANKSNIQNKSYKSSNQISNIENIKSYCNKEKFTTEPKNMKNDFSNNLYNKKHPSNIKKRVNKGSLEISKLNKKAKELHTNSNMINNASNISNNKALENINEHSKKNKNKANNNKTELTFEERQEFYSRLYKQRQTELEKMLKKEESFHPMLISRPLESFINQTESNNIEHNLINYNSMANTGKNSQNCQSIFDKNYQYYKKYNFNKQELSKKFMNNPKKDLSELSRENNNKILNKANMVAFSNLFKALDTDQDNLITNININISNVPPKILKIISPLLKEMKNDCQTLNENEFIDAMSKLFEEVSSVDRRTLLNEYLNRRNNRNNSAGILYRAKNNSFNSFSGNSFSFFGTNHCEPLMTGGNNNFLFNNNNINVINNNNNNYYYIQLRAKNLEKFLTPKYNNKVIRNEKKYRNNNDAKRGIDNFDSISERNSFVHYPVNLKRVQSANIINRDRLAQRHDNRVKKQLEKYLTKNKSTGKFVVGYARDLINYTNFRDNQNQNIRDCTFNNYLKKLN